MRTEAIVWDTTLPGIISACWKLKGVDDHEVVVVQGMLLSFINFIKNCIFLAWATHSFYFSPSEELRCKLKNCSCFSGGSMGGSGS
jgi:hypothetical protein